MNTAPNILIAGIGNIFLGDDAFGVEVVQQMLRRPQSPGVRVVDFGIRSMDLTYALLDGCDVAILVDAIPRGEAPGTLFVIQPDPIEPATPDEPVDAGEVFIDAHAMDPVKVLNLVAKMGGRLQRLLVVGCEPSPFDPEIDMEMDLSPPVRAAIPAAIEMIDSLVTKIQSGELLPANPTVGDSLQTPSKGADHAHSTAAL